MVVEKAAIFWKRGVDSMRVSYTHVDVEKGVYSGSEGYFLGALQIVVKRRIYSGRDDGLEINNCQSFKATTKLATTGAELGLGQEGCNMGCGSGSRLAIFEN